MFDPQQRSDKAVTLGLLHYAVVMPSVDQDDCQVSRRCTSGHVSGVLNMPWCVRDDKFTLGRAEIAIGDIDRDALFAFGFQTIGQVGQQRRIKAINFFSTG